MVNNSDFKIRKLTSFILILNVIFVNLEKTKEIIKKPQNNDNIEDSKEVFGENDLHDWSTKISSFNPENVLNFILVSKEVSIFDKIIYERITHEDCKVTFAGYIFEEDSYIDIYVTNPNQSIFKKFVKTNKYYFEIEGIFVGDYKITFINKMNVRFYNV